MTATVLTDYSQLSLFAATLTFVCFVLRQLQQYTWKGILWTVTYIFINPHSAASGHVAHGHLRTHLRAEDVTLTSVAQLSAVVSEDEKTEKVWRNRNRQQMSSRRGVRLTPTPQSRWLITSHCVCLGSHADGGGMCSGSTSQWLLWCLVWCAGVKQRHVWTCDYAAFSDERQRSYFLVYFHAIWKHDIEISYFTVCVLNCWHKLSLNFKFRGYTDYDNYNSTNGTVKGPILSKYHFTSIF